MPDFGKRIRQVANERWDLPDAAAALMEIIASTISRAEAGDLGVAEGVLSRSEVEFEEPSPGVYQLRLGGCLLYGCKPDDTPNNLATALPVLYDPTNTDQIQSTVEITDLDGTEGAIWWSVALAPTDLANRRVWESGYPDGRIQPLLTREYARVTFAATVGNNFNTPPATPGTWYRFAAVDFNANPPTVVLCHALDYGFENNAFQVAAGTVSANYWLGQVALANRDAASNSGRSYSVARLITQLAFSYLQALDTDFTYDVETGEVLTDGTPLTTPPARGLVQLNEGVIGVLATFQATWDGGTEDWTLSASAMSAGIYSPTIIDSAAGAGHLATLSFSVTTGYQVTGVHVQPQVGLGDPVTTNVPTLASVQSVSTLPITGANNVHSFLVLMQYWDPVGEEYVIVDNSFTFTVMGQPT